MTRIALALMSLLILLASGCFTPFNTRPPIALAQSPPTRSMPPRKPLPDVPLIEVAKRYRRGCACGVRLSNNCAHFLSNAFIEAGYTDLLESDRIGSRCAMGRVIRAQDMLRWFQSRSKRFQMGPPPPNSGLWAIYQEKPNRHHVLLLDTNTGKYYGTDNCTDWPVQWCYQW